MRFLDDGRVDAESGWFAAGGVLASAPAGFAGVWADPETGQVAGLVAEWGRCLRGAGRTSCPHLTAASTDVRVFNQRPVVCRDGQTVRAGGLALGPPHPRTSRAHGATPEEVMHETMAPENRAAIVTAHVTAQGIMVAGVVAPELVGRAGSVGAAAAQINSTSFSIHAGETPERQGVHELWGVFGVTAPGMPLAASVAAACSCGDQPDPEVAVADSEPVVSGAAAAVDPTPVAPVDITKIVEQAVADALAREKIRADARSLADIDPLH